MDIRNAKPTMYWIGGSKGGVGKSMVTMAVLDQILDAERRTLLVECDTSNPDVCKAYDRLVTTELVDLDGADGWIHLVNTCETRKDSTIVVNTAARNNVGVRNYGRTLESSLDELGRELVVLWVVNRQRDSLELLREFMDRFRAPESMSSETATSARSENSRCTTSPRCASRSRAPGECR